MKVEIWTDIICPWCGLGYDSLRKALAQFAHGADVELVHRSFQLDEHAQSAPRPVRDMLRDKLKMPDAQVAASTARIEQLAKAQGLAPYIVADNHVANTSLAHELAAWATEQGAGQALWEALYRAYFAEARSIFDVESLVALAAEVGLDQAAAREALTSRRYAERVRADGREARALGANGVPFVVIDRRYGVPGAQPTDVLVAALTEAWNTRLETNEAAATPRTQEGAICGPDGCADA